MHVDAFGAVGLAWLRMHLTVTASSRRSLLQPAIPCNTKLVPFRKMKIKILLALAGLLTGCATASNESEYNLGVESFRVKDYSNARVHWQAAATQNVRAAHNNLGYLLYYGMGGTPELLALTEN